MNSRLRIALFLAASGLCGSTALAEATIEGKVALPKPHVPVANRRYAISSKAGIAAPTPSLAVVYVEGNFPAAAAGTTKQMVQKGIAFSPRLLPVQVGTRVEFPNEDDTEHSVYAPSARP